MGLLSPPILATTIPAFYSTAQGIVITIPFSMNRSVSPAQVAGFAVKIKTVQSGSVLGTYLITENITLMLSQKEIQLIIPSDDDNKYLIGQFYKIQVAYIEETSNIIGNYSSITVGKYTSYPSNICINNLYTGELNSHRYTYEGIYEQEKDVTERVYNYCFDLYNSDGELISSSGDLLHNSDEDDLNTPNKSRDLYTFTLDLPLGNIYRIKYSVKTVNNLIASSPAYRIAQQQSINSDLNATINVDLNFDNGYMDIKLVSNDNNLVSGSFILSRSSEISNYSEWEEIHRFSLTSQIPTLKLFKDFTIKQGERYKYSIQQYSDLLISNRILSDIVYADFEDAFLYDGTRQLKIKYNPKVSSFKKDLLETKTDTIGGKHPFIFRNGRVYYSEFPISGLISYQMDEENLFLSEAELNLAEKTTNLTGENIAAERIFKMKVLEWLTNGEPKVFRSPTEGNFIVRLMNSSLSPNDTVGRMLHTFSCTAYEVADYNYTTLGEMGFIQIKDLETVALQIETILLEGKPINTNLLLYPATKIKFQNMNYGDMINIKFVGSDEEEEIRIGVTGNYELDNGMQIAEVKLNTPSNGTLEYWYYIVQKSGFETISSIEVKEIPGSQFFGAHNILQDILSNPKIKLMEPYLITVEKLPLQTLSDIEEISSSILYLNDDEIDMTYRNYLELKSPGKITKFISPEGCLTTFSYAVYNIEYNIEKQALTVSEGHDLFPLKEAMQNYNESQRAFQEYLNNLDDKTDEEIVSDVDAMRKDMQDKYNIYIQELINAQENEVLIRMG